MAKREKRKVIAGITADQYQDALAVYATSDAKADKLVAQMNVEVTRIREKYDGTLTELMQEKEKQQEIIQAYCTENKETMFSDKRSVETAYGKVGFRLGTPKLKTLPKFTWDRVLDKLELLMPDFIRTKKEVDKEALLANRSEAKVANHLSEVGVYVDQDETFFIELKKEEAEAA